MAVGATAVWRVRTGGNNANGGGFDAGLSGAGTDYSQQDAAQLGPLTDIACSATTTVTSATGGFTSAMIGNAIWITGGGATAGAYFITARTDTNTITVDRSPGTVTNGTGRVGGAWANPTTNAAQIVAGNILYIRGAGSDFPTAVDYTPTAIATLTGSANRPIRVIGENGRPMLGASGTQYFTGKWTSFENLVVRYTAATGTPAIKSQFGDHTCAMYYCAFDQNGYDTTLLGGVGEWVGNITRCEFYSSVAKRTTNTRTAVIGAYSYGEMFAIDRCFFHDLVGRALDVDSGISVINSTFAANGGVGIYVSAHAFHGLISGNTLAANAGNANIEIASQALVNRTRITDNIISDHGTAGIRYSGAGSSAEASAWLDVHCRRNLFYNNAANAVNFTLSADNTTGTDPQYADAANRDYTPRNPAILNTVVVPDPGQMLAAPKTYGRSNRYPGAIQSPGATVIAPVTNLYLQGG